MLAANPGESDSPLFPSGNRTPLSTDTVAWLITKYATTAATLCPSLTSKRVTPHTLRHTAAMFLREAAVDISVIALWLGHESIASTQIYMHTDLAVKQRALDRTTQTQGTTNRNQPRDALLTYLESL
jgi:site-specific recombinase XerD